MNLKATSLLALLTISCDDVQREQKPSRLVEAPLCWKSGMVAQGDRLKGVGTAFYNPDGPLVLGATRCRDLSFQVLFRDRNLERATLDTMRETSTGDAFGGQHYLVEFEGIVVGDGTDGTDLRLERFKILRRVANEAAYSPNA